MVNVSQVLLREFRQTHPDSGVLDLKAYFRAAKYFEETIKMLPEKPEPILLDQIFGHVASLGCIHPVNVQIFFAVIGEGIVNSIHLIFPYRTKLYSLYLFQKDITPQVLGRLRGRIVCVCLGSPSVMWLYSHLDRSFVPLSFDRYTFSVLLYKPR